jgi:hypothetical protein
MKTFFVKDFSQNCGGLTGTNEDFFVNDFSQNCGGLTGTNEDFLQFCLHLDCNLAKELSETESDDTVH